MGGNQGLRESHGNSISSQMFHRRDGPAPDAVTLIFFDLRSDWDAESAGEALELCLQGGGR
jgi:hypothetical protein